MTTRDWPELVGLVLAGGESRRMNADKGSLDFRGQSLVAHCLRTIEPHCKSVLVSIRRGQSELEAYRELPFVVDDEGISGPAAGLVAAWSRFPDRALLVLAVDLPLVTAETIEYLVSRRNAAVSATAFRHNDGTIEPLCTVWEPCVREALDRAPGSPSLRRILEDSDAEVLDPPNPDELKSANTPEALQAALTSMRARFDPARR